MTDNKLKGIIEEHTKALQNGVVTREQANEKLLQLLKDHAATQSERAKAIQRGVSSMESTRSLEINEAHYAKRLAAKDAEIAQWREQTIAASSEIDRLRIEAKRLREGIQTAIDRLGEKAPIDWNSAFHAVQEAVDDLQDLLASDGEKPLEMPRKERDGSKGGRFGPDKIDWNALDSPAPTEERLNEVLDHFKGLNKGRQLDGDFDPRHCEAGCRVYSGGERKHHPDCRYYPESFSRLYDELKAKLGVLPAPLPSGDLHAEWERLRLGLGDTSHWTAGDFSNLYGAFCHGWYGRMNEAAYQQENGPVVIPAIVCPECESHRIEKIGVNPGGRTMHKCWECHAEFSEGGAK